MAAAAALAALLDPGRPPIAKYLLLRDLQTCVLACVAHHEHARARNKSAPPQCKMERDENQENQIVDLQFPKRK